jgi:Aromatic acid exporter family member 1
VVKWWRGFVSRELSRVRRDGRAALLWSLRITVAATASYVVASLFFPGTEPLLAPLTAMLVVQVTPLSLLASGLDRVIAVVAGVSLAVAFAAVVPLEWWSLGVLILISITLGQFLRLRSNLVEVAISAMLVLGVGAIGAEAAAWQRIAETLVGAAVGVIATLVFPPKVASSDAGRAIDGLADAISELLVRAAQELDAMAEAEPQRLASAAREWLDDARRITHDIPVVGAALLRAEEGRRLNVRAVRAPHVEPGLRQGLEALEHSAVSIRGLMRSVVDASDGDWLDTDSAGHVLGDLAEAFRQLARGTDAFGELVRHEGDVQVSLSRDDITRLQEAQDGMLRARDRIDAGLVEGQPADLVELYAATRATIRRLQQELALDERVRRQLRLLPPRRLPTRAAVRRRSASDWPGPTGPDDETQVLPRLSEEPPEDVP